MSEKILVTPRSLTGRGHPALNRLTEAGFQLVFSAPEKQPDEHELLRLLPGCVGYLAGVEKIGSHVLASADHLRVISRNGTGVDNIDLVAAQQRQVQVCRAEGANARGVAELTWSLILDLARSVPFSDGRMKQGQWERRMGTELEGKTLGLIGCGRIGKLVAQFAAVFGSRVLAYDPFPDAAFRPSDHFEYVERETIWPRADIVSLHCNVPQNGRPLIDARLLEKIKVGAFLVNTARASLVEEEAVLAALNSGQLSGYATDVYREEPPRDLRLTTHPKVIATPHLGGFTHESISRAVDVAVENLLAVLRGTTPRPHPFRRNHL